MAATNNPLRFGVNIRVPDFKRYLELARAAEAAGFDTITFSDRPPEQNLEGWTLASAIGALTQRVILTHSTLNVPSATRECGEDGRLARRDYRRRTCGADLAPAARSFTPHLRNHARHAGERFLRLRETVTVLRGIWTSPPFTYWGRWCRLRRRGTAAAYPRDNLIWIALASRRCCATPAGSPTAG